MLIIFRVQGCITILAFAEKIVIMIASMLYHWHNEILRNIPNIFSGNGIRILDAWRSIVLVYFFFISLLIFL
ncbi:hypothetical protein GLOIN_2v1665784 [Rhizophagus irregularis DAOM 181602=DAOM 197198]|uniref:Uncharacterized protein n=1 Tax=Rhizophagus irregularis (strain DAOM 181602 / DAOM 197198 / MUCL 43194) TaxID=747089 RepID=A0A2P4PJE3_RHIID|nr:hypothetical protein GLOIN_2v1665784 [Rhizophagus irregularis DAOM 181602=DAOM 197198]POG65503.1 hypothetical protein GLOIN_2v1665784 [Rhizophagus irregularis DAOM 181602=DAOM 197198]|eukprot:XP_025172369.1 hypothetical protein GLOIN_2v1665784 [Rhizophagus irregularis DAOM 181602=DAOM 197198]